LNSSRLGNKVDPFHKAQLASTQERAAREAEKQRIALEKAQNRKDRNLYYRERRQQTKQLMQKNERGQPNMNNRVSMLLSKLKKEG
jgi:hypothetical protein